MRMMAGIWSYLPSHWLKSDPLGSAIKPAGALRGGAAEHCRHDLAIIAARLNQSPRRSPIQSLARCPRIRSGPDGSANRGLAAMFACFTSSDPAISIYRDQFANAVQKLLKRLEQTLRRIISTKL